MLMRKTRTGFMRGARRWRCALLAVFLAANVATELPAQTADVFSGEHPNSSRIVVRFDRPTSVSARRVEDGYRVRFVPRPPALDLTGVFRLIPRDRISDVRQNSDDGSLTILSECDCVLETFDAGEFTYAIDVRDRRPDEPADGLGTAKLPGTSDRVEEGPAGEDSRSRAIVVPTGGGAVRPAISTASDILPAGTTIAAARRPPGRPLPASNLLPFPLLKAPPIGENSATSLGRNRPIPEIADASDRSRHGPAASSPRRTDMGGGVDALTERFRQAADAAVVALRDDGAGTGSPGSAGDPSEDPFRKVEAASSRLSSLADNLSVRLGPDTISTRGTKEQPVEVCPPGDRFAFLSGDDDGDAFEELRALRADLVTEAGDIDPDGALALAKRYLAMGFGAEAAQMLALSELSSEELARYASLARIVDRTGDSAPEVWRGQEACPSDVALWAVLGQDGQALPEDVDAAAVQRAFFGLNAPMRLHLGPVLAKHLDAIGRPDAAAAIRTNIEPLRNASAHATADGAETGPLAGRGAAERAVSDLLSRALSAMRAGRPIQQDDLRLAEALAWEYRGTEEGLKLAGMTALGRLVDNDVPGAMAILEDQWQQADPAWTSTLTDAFADTVLAKGDAELLELVLHPRGGEVIALLDGAQLVAVADRLTGVGFPDLALDLLTDIEEPSAGVRRARAAAHLSAGDPARALALIAGLPGRQAAAVRAEALEALERYALAAPAYADAGDAAGAARAAWLSGDARMIAAFGSDRHKGLAERLLRPRRADDPLASPDAPVRDTGLEVEPPDAAPRATTESSPRSAARPEEPPTMREGQALIERSAALRSDIAELLESIAE